VKPNKIYAEIRTVASDGALLFCVLVQRFLVSP